MKLSKTQQTKLRKYVPLVVLYPLSTGVGVVSTIYVSKTINRSYPASDTSATTPTTTSTQASTATTLSQQQLLEQQRVVQLEAQIARLKSQIQQPAGAASTENGQLPPSANAPGTGGTQSSPPATQSPANPPKTVVTAPPPTHGSTGASRALG